MLVPESAKRYYTCKYCGKMFEYQSYDLHPSYCREKYLKRQEEKEKKLIREREEELRNKELQKLIERNYLFDPYITNRIINDSYNLLFYGNDSVYFIYIGDPIYIKYKNEKYISFSDSKRDIEKYLERKIENEKERLKTYFKNRNRDYGYFVKNLFIPDDKFAINHMKQTMLPNKVLLKNKMMIKIFYLF